MKMTAPDLEQLQVIDEIVPEPTGGSHSDWDRTAEYLKEALVRQLGELKNLSTDELLRQRRKKFMAMGEWHEAQQAPRKPTATSPASRRKGSMR